MLIDVDNFRRYNDRFGLQAGDDCPQGRGSRCQALRPLDFCARYSGIQFAIVLANPTGCTPRVPQRVRQAVAALEIPHPDSQRTRRHERRRGATAPRAIDSREEFIELARRHCGRRTTRAATMQAKESQLAGSDHMFTAEVALAATDSSRATRVIGEKN
jgi:GGDEF domain-containing protein